MNWLLLRAGDAVTSLWQWTKSLFGGLFTTVDGWLDPLLSPALAVLNPICTSIGDAVYALLRPLPAWLGLVIISVLTGIVMLVVFRYASNQEAIGRAKDDIKANLLALKLFKDDLRVSFRAQGRLFCAILRLQRYVLTPVLIMLVPMLLGLAQMGTRYQWRPLRPGERTLIKVQLAEGSGGNSDIRLQASPAAIVEVAAVPGDNALYWRIRGETPGRHLLNFHLGGTIVQKELVVAAPGTASLDLEPVNGTRASCDWTVQLFHPREARLPVDQPARFIEADYPPRESWVYGTNWWVLHFFALSMLTALLLRPLFKVRF